MQILQSMTTMVSSHETECNEEMLPSGGWIRRVLFAVAGLLFVALGAIGAVLPGIPTVGPLILASLCFGKSFPALEKRLIRNRFFARFHKYLDSGATMPLRARILTIAVMWTSIGISMIGLAATGNGPWWLLTTLAVAGLVGTAAIARFRSNRFDSFRDN